MFPWDRSRLKLAYGVCVALTFLVVAVVAFTHHTFNPAPNPDPVDADPEEPPVEQTPYAPRRDDPEAPRLAVLVVFDQMRGDYLTRWDGLFGEGGFRRLEKDGVWFTNCHFPYASTFTGPGHASLATGCSPMTHGIIANTWCGAASGKEIDCVDDDTFTLALVLTGKLKEEVGEWPGPSPRRLRADTLGDALKGATEGKGRVVSLSLKARSAVLLGCRAAKPDACYWFFPPLGTFVTSTYYRDTPHPWVAEFNDARPADRWFGKDWTRLRPDLDYAAHSGPDDVAGEDTGWEQGRTFPLAMRGGLDAPGHSYYGAVETSPYGNELLLEFAKRAIDREGLGRNPTPDLLCLSFSANDTIGHCWGPDSQEVLDATLRSDLVVRDLLNYLDDKVGRGRYVVVVTADHGICPLPEMARRKGLPGERVSIENLYDQAEEFLGKTFSARGGKGRWLRARSGPWYYLDRRTLKANKVEQATVEEALAGWLSRQPGVQGAYTRTRLTSGPFADDAIGERVRRSFHATRSGDVAVVLKPYHLPGDAQTLGTTHGSPHSYDTHVPFLIYGPGLRPGVRDEGITPQAATAILAHSLRIEPPHAADAPMPGELHD
jgi:predicted AlkP superfamily pyrophosphatase or phosphodiesterase